MRIDVIKRVCSPPVDAVAALADEHFQLPATPVPYWESSDAQKPWRRRLRASA
jgi:hypothetical protein